MAHPRNGKPEPSLSRPREDMPSAKEIAEAKAAARKKETKLNVDWADARAVRAFVEKYRK